MDMQLTDGPDELVEGTPEDVAILYSWANMQGARYRDFSASRREYRAQVRHRAAEETRQAELRAQAEAERAAADAEHVAREAEHAVQGAGGSERSRDRVWAERTAQEAGRRAAAVRVEAARRAEAVALAEAAARREEREMAEAHASAERQAARWNESEIRWHSSQPGGVPARRGDPYEVAQGSTVDAALPTPNRALEYTQPQVYERPGRERDEFSTAVEEGRVRASEPEWRGSRGYKPNQPSGIRPALLGQSGEVLTEGRSLRETETRRLTLTPSAPSAQRTSVSGSQHQAHGVNFARPEQDLPIALQEPLAPAWLTGPVRNSGTSGSRTASGLHTVADTLQDSRDKVASRWFALKDAFETGSDEVSQLQDESSRRRAGLAVFSLAGGVGKTSLVATLGRALASLGEKVLLAETTSHGLLPYYFGATELKAGVVRTFSPPSGSADDAISLVSYDADARGMDRGLQDALARQILADAGAVHRMLLDFNAASGWLIRRLPMVETILVPLTPDMSSVISLQAVEKYLDGESDVAGQPMLPFYVLNHFDASVPLHLDVREVLRRQLGERLLPLAIRRSPTVSEALADGMTVIDYQLDSGIAQDYLNVAKWLHSVPAAAANGPRAPRWSER